MQRPEVQGEPMCLLPEDQNDGPLGRIKFNNVISRYDTANEITNRQIDRIFKPYTLQQYFYRPTQYIKASKRGLSAIAELLVIHWLSGIIRNTWIWSIIFHFLHFSPRAVWSVIFQIVHYPMPLLLGPSFSSPAFSGDPHTEPPKTLPRRLAGGKRLVPRSVCTYAHKMMWATFIHNKTQKL